MFIILIAPALMVFTFRKMAIDEAVKTYQPSYQYNEIQTCAFQLLTKLSQQPANGKESPIFFIRVGKSIIIVIYKVSV